MTKKNVLIVYPHDFREGRSGIDARYIELLKYFKNRGFNVDMLTLTNFQSPWENPENARGDLVREIYFYDFKKGARGQKQKNKKRDLRALLRKRMPFCTAFKHLPDFAYPGMKKQFDGILQKTPYDFVIISYVYWAGLITSGAVGNTRTVLDLSDFMTLNRFDSSGGDVKIGPMIEEEIRRVNLFHTVMCISDDEKTFFSRFALGPRYYYVPFFMEKHEPVTAVEPGYDILFIGSDNPHNKKGIAWFFEKVVPLWDNPYRILIAGKISEYVDARAGVTRRPHVEDLGEVYGKSRIAICPLRGGTGMKIKVVEALSYGLPVVTTSRGVSGFPCKTDCGCLIADSPKAFARTIRRLLTEDRLYREQHDRAAAFFPDHFGASAVYRRLDEIFCR